jgi:putative ABC transport system permease protein
VARLLETLLFGVPSVGESTALAVGLLGVVAMSACLVPALRATRVDPVVALRND